MSKDNDVKKNLNKESLFDTISDSAPFGLFVTDTEGSCIWANAEYQKITGLDASEIPGTGWSRTIHAKDRSRILEILYKATETNEAFSSQYRIMNRDGTDKFMRIRAAPIYAEGRATGIIGAVEDVTLRLKMESQLRINFAAMESSTAMTMITDEKGLITWVNPAFSHGTGYSFGDIVGQNPGFLSASPDSPVKKAVRDILATGQPWKGEVFNRRKDGSIFLEEEIITPVYDNDGKIGHLLAIKKDITVERENEKKLPSIQNTLKSWSQKEPANSKKRKNEYCCNFNLNRISRLRPRYKIASCPRKCLRFQASALQARRLLPTTSAGICTTMCRKATVFCTL